MVKRKIDRTRSKKKQKKSRKITNNEDEEDKDLSNEFTAEEEEEHLAIHIRRSPPKKRRSNNAANGDNDGNVDDIDNSDGDDDINEEDDKNVDNNNNGDSNDDDDDDDDDDDNGGDNEDEDDDGDDVDKNKFEVRQRVLARDEDGILYYADIRRKLQGVNHHKTISCLGIFDIAPEEIENETNFDNDEDNKNQNEWHYFVHYEGWKSTWDRWVAESDIWEITEVSIERMKEISMTHKALQREFKGKTKKGKIQNGGLFLKEWKEQLDGLHRQWAEHDSKSSSQQGSTTTSSSSNGEEKDKQIKKVKKRKKKPKPKKSKKSSTEILHDRSDLAIQSCLTTRQPSHIQAIPLSFGLKRILVEDWENLNSTGRAEEVTTNVKDASSSASLETIKWDMVHALPAKITIRNALSLYLKDKGISWDGIVLRKNQATTSSSNENSKNNDETLNKNDKISESESNQNNLLEPGQSLLIKDEQKEKSSVSTMDDTCGKVVAATNEYTQTDNLSKPGQAASMKNEQEEKSTSNVNDTCTEVLVATDTSKYNPEETSTKDAQIDMTASLPDKTPSQKEVTKDENNNDDNVEEEVSLQLAKEWTDMADGIVLYFEQALMSRLLYPSEISQLLVLEDGLPDDTPFLQKVDIYGCEHLLRLLASMPRILDQQFQDSRKKKMERKQNALIKDGDTTEQEKIEDGNDDDETDADQDAFVEVGSMILAKLQDFARFLQKNQSTLFGSLYRKKNDEEIKRDLKIQKRQERRLQSAAAKATSVMLQKTDQQGEGTDINDDDDDEEENPMQLE